MRNLLDLNSDDEMAAELGRRVVAAFNLERHSGTGDNALYWTNFGNKTLAGVGRVAADMVFNTPPREEEGGR